MRIFLLLCLLALGNAKPYQPINVMEFMKNYDIMMADSSDDDDDDDKDDDDYDANENCPAGCHCSPRVVQCSDMGENTHSMDTSGSTCYCKHSVLKTP